MPDAVVLGEAEVGGDKSKNSLEEEEKQKAGYQHDNERDPYFDTLNIWVWVLLGGSDDVKLFNRCICVIWLLSPVDQCWHIEFAHFSHGLLLFDASHSIVNFCYICLNYYYYYYCYYEFI